MPTQLDSRQVKKRIALTKLGAAAGATVESILDKINIEVDSPLRLAASVTPDALLNFAATLVSAADLANEVVSPVKKQIFSTLAASTINFQTQALSNAAYFDITWPTPNVVGRFRYAAFTLIGSGKIKVLFSAEATSEALLSNPGALFVSGGLPIGYVALECTNTLGYFKTAGSATNIIENTKIYRLAAGGGASSSSSGGSGGGGELVDLLYNIDYRDSFVNIPDGTTTVDVSAGFTDPSLHDVANELFRISYDATKTISAVGTAVTISSAPTFTVKIGDIINVPGTDSPKKITAVASQTSVTVESAWTVNPSSAACNISQAVHTQDLNAFTAGGTGLSAASQYTGNIDEIMVGYEDTTTAGDIIPDFGTAAVIAFSASSDATNWTIAAQRVASLSSQELAAALPTSSTQLRLRFFSNATSGSGSVNLLAYKVFFHKVTGSQIGSALLTAFARPTSGLYQSVSHSVVGGKSRFQFTFGYPRGLNAGEASGSALEVYVNGQRVPRFVSGITDPAQAYFTEDSGSVITMDTDYSAAGVDFQFMVKTPVIDSSTGNTTQISAFGDILDQQLDAQVISTFLTAVNGTPSAIQFRSDITGRASVIDQANALSALLGPQRLMVQDIYLISNESGSAGQTVFGAVNDKFNQIRFVGNWVPTNNISGQGLQSSSLNDYMEYVFWGTSASIILETYSVADDIRASVDGGAEGANLYVGTTYSNILANQKYSSNNEIVVASGLSFGKHTVRIRKNAAVLSYIFGFQSYTETSAIQVAAGAAVQGRYKNINSALQAIAYSSDFESGTLGTRGGRALIYVKNDGTIGKALTPTNTSSARFAAADHTNEEVIRVFNAREYGVGGTTDFGSLLASGSARAFTLDDASHTLVSTNGAFQVFGTTEVANISSNNGETGCFTFIGTGLDLIMADSSNGGSDTYTYSIDGEAFIPWAYTAGSTTFRTQKIVSGLPYGSHTFRIRRVTAATWNVGILQFVVYGPKKPTIPVGAIAQAEYYINSNYVPVASLGGSIANSLGTIASGVIRKFATRENTYVGAWAAIVLDVNSMDSGYDVGYGPIGSYFEKTDFCTGMVVNGFAPTAATNITILVDGIALNAGANAVATVTLIQSSTGLSLSAAGVLTGSSAANAKYKISISGLALGRHTIRITQNATNSSYIDTLDIITPIHFPSSNLGFDVQNTMMVGNNVIGDLRKFNKRDVVTVNRTNVSKAAGIVSGPTTNSTSFVPCPDLSVTHYNSSGSIEVSALLASSNTAGGNDNYIQVYIDGVPRGNISHAASISAGLVLMLSLSQTFAVAPGFHKVDIYWKVSAGTATAFSIDRNLEVKER